MTIHCGDVGPEIVPLLRSRQVHFIAGNMDDGDALREAIVEPEHTLHEQLGTLELEGRRVAFLHGHDVKLLHHTIHSGHWDLVCHGHTHVFFRQSRGPDVGGQSGRLSHTNSPSLAVVELPSMEVTEIPL